MYQYLVITLVLLGYPPIWLSGLFFTPTEPSTSPTIDIFVSLSSLTLYKIRLSLNDYLTN